MFLKPSHLIAFLAPFLLIAIITLAKRRGAQPLGDAAAQPCADGGSVLSP
jgi:hypothetical protein